MDYNIVDLPITDEVGRTSDGRYHRAEHAVRIDGPSAFDAVVRRVTVSSPTFLSSTSEVVRFSESQYAIPNSRNIRLRTAAYCRDWEESDSCGKGDRSVPWATGRTRSTGTFAVYAPGEDLPAADDCHIPVGILGVHDHGVTPAAASPEYTSGNVSPSPAARSPTGVMFLRQPTRPLAVAGPSLESASHKRQDGRPLRGDPRAPILVTDLCWGTTCLGYPAGCSQEQSPETPSRRRLRRDLHIGATVPGGVPVGLRRRGRD